MPILNTNAPTTPSTPTPTADTATPQVIALSTNQPETSSIVAAPNTDSPENSDTPKSESDNESKANESKNDNQPKEDSKFLGLGWLWLPVLLALGTVWYALIGRRGV